MLIRLFGRVTVEGPSTELDAGSPTQKKLLALLALNPGRKVSLDRLYEDMWNGETPANAEQMIRIYVSRLRKLLGAVPHAPDPATLLSTEAGGYRLALDEASVDVSRFERLIAEGEETGDPHLIRDALALWRDVPLSEFPYEEFAIRIRDRLETARIDALETALGYEMDRGVGRATLRDVAALVEENPYRERLWAHLIVGLHLSGRQAEAFRAYERCRAELAEIGLEPGPELKGLVASIAGPETPSPRRRTSELPLELDSFVGRVSALAGLGTALDGNRLVTVVGPGGSGKTRLAIRFASQAETAVWFADLSVATSSDAVREVFEAAFGASPASDIIEAAAHALGDSPGLLVVDNCEHLIDPATAVVERLLAGVAGLRVLATSREPLRMRGEHLVRIDPLGLPDDSSIEAVAASEAGRLFFDRARASSDFQIDASNSPMVAEILRQLDGIPLAIELAASRLDVVPLDSLAETLFEELADAGASRRTLLPRHRTLQAALDWSYRLLDEPERVLFRRLGVIQGDFDQDLVLSLGASQSSLRALVARSMVVSSGDDHRLLVPLHSYARALLERLGEDEETEAIRDAYYLEVGEQLAAIPRGFELEEWQAKFRRHRPNLVLAINRLREEDAASAARLMISLSEYWQRLGFYAEGMRLLELSLGGDPGPGVEIDLNLALSRFFEMTGQMQRSVQMADAAVESAERRGDQERLAHSLNQRGTSHGLRGHLYRAISDMEPAADLYAAHKPEEWYVPLINLAAGLVWSGDYARAEGVVARLRARELPQPSLPFLDALSGMASRFAGALDEGDSRLEKAADSFSRDRSDFHLRLCFVERAQVRLEMGDLSGAEVLAGMALAGTDGSEVGVYNFVRARRILAEVAWGHGDGPRAIAVLLGAVELADLNDMDGALAELADTAAVLAVGIDRKLSRELATWSDEKRELYGVARDPYEQNRRDSLPSDVSSDSLGSGDPLDRFRQVASL